ncbi:CoA transferase [Brevibacterium salitolerans]|uniref:CoA transferase n=1 Tax=Brevibacterium salitolerans TaxID=1403566 RepID=A0ABN2X1I8_9MICO
MSLDPQQDDAPQAGFLPLDGVRVLELGNYIAAPTAGRMLADFGAEVIKVERPRTGDELRNWKLHTGTTSLLFRTINRNKRSVVLDLRSEAGREAVLALVRDSDVLLENFRPGTLERWGLGPEVLEEANPELVLVRVSAFGQTGPLAERPGFAAVAEAHSGFRDLVGDPDRPPVRVGVSIGDSIAGMQAAFGACMMLFERERRRSAGAAGTPGSGARTESTASGAGSSPTLAQRTVDVALHEAMFSVLESLVPDYSATGTLRRRTGGRMEGIAPTNAYLCAGGRSVVIAGNGDGIFSRYMRVIGRPDLAEREDLQTNAGRWAARDELDEAIGAWTTPRSVEEVLEALEAADVPAGPIHTAADLVRDPQLLARDMIQTRDVAVVDHAGEDGDAVLRDIAFPGITPVLGGTSLPIRTLGPDLGADTADVLARAGLDEETVRRIEEETR